MIHDSGLVRSAPMSTPSLHPSTPALAASLIDDPFYQAVTIDFEHDAAARLAVLAHYLDCAVREAQRGGLCHTLDDPRLGMAIWTLPRPAQIEAADARAKSDHLQSVLTSTADQVHTALSSSTAKLSPA